MNATHNWRTPPLSLNMLSKDAKQTFRRALLSQRQHLDPNKKQQLDAKLCLRLKQQYIFKTSNRIAFYKAHNQEVDLLACQRWALQHHKSIYLPVLHPTKYHFLSFVKITPDTQFKKNIFGIEEPHPLTDPLPPWQLDLVIMPLVAFDDQKNRLGMGGGFYDRTFAFKHRHQAKKPFLMGVAFDFQKIQRVPTKAHDIALDAVLTPTQVYS